MRRIVGPANGFCPYSSYPPASATRPPSARGQAARFSGTYRVSVTTPEQLHWLKAAHIHISQFLDPFKVNPLNYLFNRLPDQFAEALTVRLTVPDSFDTQVETWFGSHAVKVPRPGSASPSVGDAETAAHNAEAEKLEHV